MRNCLPKMCSPSIVYSTSGCVGYQDKAQGFRVTHKNVREICRTRRLSKVTRSLRLRYLKTKNNRGEADVMGINGLRCGVSADMEDKQLIIPTLKRERHNVRLWGLISDVSNATKTSFRRKQHMYQGNSKLSELYSNNV